jgi:hypothetical protein
MATLSIAALLEQMVDAGKTSFGSSWPGVCDLATSSFKKLAHTLVHIEEMRLDGIVTDEQARLLLDMEKNTFKIVMLSLQGMSLLLVEAALNAALDVVRTTVNTAVGFLLL